MTLEYFSFTNCGPQIHAASANRAPNLVQASLLGQSRESICSVQRGILDQDGILRRNRLIRK